MHVAVGNNSRTATDKEESNSINEKIPNNCSNCTNTILFGLLELVWNYQMPSRWIFFYFVLQTLVATFVTKYFLVQHFGGYHVFWVGIGNLIFLYLWMSATGRISHRLRTPREMSEFTPIAFLRTAGIFFLVSGTMMCVGEEGVERYALGDANYNSISFKKAGSATFMLGIFNLVLASKTNIWWLTFTTWIANGLVFLKGTLQIIDVARLFRDHCWSYPVCIYSVKQDFPNRWVEAHGADNAIPFGSITTFDFIRTVPVFATVFLAGCVALSVLHSLIKMDMTEDNSASKITKKVPKKNYATAIIGLAITLVSFLVIKCLSDANSLLYLTRTYELYIAAAWLTSLGLFGIITLHRQAPSWFRVLLMAAAAVTFITAYSTLDYATIFEKEVSKFSSSVLNSNCSGDPKDNQRIDYSVVPPFAASEHDVTTKRNIQGKLDQTCFQVKDGLFGTMVGIKCIPKEKICDGIVDIAEPVEICSAIPNYHVYQGERGIQFIDEILCPANGAHNIATAIRAANWLSMALSLAMVVALALTFNEDSDEKMLMGYDTKSCQLSHRHKKTPQSTKGS